LSARRREISLKGWERRGIPKKIGGKMGDLKVIYKKWGDERDEKQELGKMVHNIQCNWEIRNK
jgi:hypothetical protein